MPLRVVENDLLQMDVNAIVNPANSMLAAGGGVCGAIFEAAGYEKLQCACDAIGSCEPGKAVITPGFGLKQPWIIHTVGPVWYGGRSGEEKILASAYRSSLALAEEKGLGSIAFPLISAGIFGYPKDEAFRIALDTIRSFLMEKDEREMDVYVVLLDRKAVSIGQKLFGEIKSYLEENGFDEEPWLSRRRAKEADILEKQRARQQMINACIVPAFEKEQPEPPSTRPDALPDSVDAEEEEEESACFGSYIHAEGMRPQGFGSAPDMHAYELGESFSACLLRMIDERNLRDPQVYKAANIDRKLFSKIRSNAAYRPKKDTAIALAIGLGLTVGETQELLETAGYTLSRSSLADTIVRACLEKGIHDIFEINELLFRYDQQPLGA